MSNDDRAPKDAEFTPRIGRPALGALTFEGYTRYENIAQLTKRQLRRIHGVGPKAVGILEEELAARGMAFADHD